MVFILFFLLFINIFSLVYNNIFVTMSLTFVVLLVFFLLYLFKDKLNILLISYLIPVSLILFSIVLIPWTKTEYRVGPIPVVYIPFLLYAIVISFMGVFQGKGIRINSGDKLINLSLAYFLCFSTFSFLWVVDITSWFVYLAQWYIYIICIFGFTTKYFYFNGENAIYRVIRFMVVAIGFISFSGLIKFFAFDYPDANPILLLNRNASIFAMLPFIPFLFALIQMSKNKIIYVILLTVVFLDILFIFSRTAYLSVILCVVIYLFLIRRDIGFFNYLKIFYFGLYGVLVVFSMAYLFLEESLVQSLLSRFMLISNIFNFFENGLQSLGSSDIRRGQLITAGIEIFKSHYLLGTGLGIDNYLHYFPQHINTTPGRAHNLYVSYLAEFGVVGFSFLLFFLLYTGYYFYKSTLSIKKKINQYFGYAFVSGHLMLLVSFAGNEYITFPIVWFFWGLGFAYFRINKMS